MCEGYSHILNILVKSLAFLSDLRTGSHIGTRVRYAFGVPNEEAENGGERTYAFIQLLLHQLEEFL
jgi:hypothetical protein